MGRHSTQMQRKEKYLSLFKELEYKPSTRELAPMLGISANQVSRDLRELGLTELWNSLNEKTPLNDREKYYKENYFNLSMEERPSTHQIAKELGISHNSVARDIRALSEKYDMPVFGKKMKMYEHGFENRKEKYLSYFEKKGYIPFMSEMANYFSLPAYAVYEDYKKLGVKPITQEEYANMKFLEGVELHKDFYIQNYFNTFTPMTIREMAEYFGVYRNIVLRELHYLIDTFGYNQIATSKGFSKRKKMYEDYISQFGNVFTLKMVSDKLGIPLDIVVADFKKLKILYELPPEVRYAYLLPRLEVYKKYNLETDNPITYSEMAAKAGVHLTQFYKDKEILEKYFGYVFKKSPWKMGFEKRVVVYTEYLNKNEFKGIKKMAEELGYSFNLVCYDFNRRGLYKYFGIK